MKNRMLNILAIIAICFIAFVIVTDETEGAKKNISGNALIQGTYSNNEVMMSIFRVLAIDKTSKEMEKVTKRVYGISD